MEEPRFDLSDGANAAPEGSERSTSAGPVIAIVAVLVVVVAAAGWYWLRRGRGADAAPAVGAAAPGPAPASSAPPAEPAIELPPLGASDAMVRELTGRLSAHPRLVAWLANDRLVRRFVASVINVAEGVSPASHLRFLTPAEPFTVRASEGRTVAAASSFHRFDTLTEVFVSLDEPGTARLYRQLHPLFEDAYREIGDPNRDFDRTMELAIGNVLAVEVPAGPIEVVPSGAGYHLADPELESWTTSEKHLLRLGPDNARRVQAKLRRLADAIGLEPR